MVKESLMDTTNTKFKSFYNVIDRNTLVWWTLILISIFLFVFVSPWGGLFWLGALLVDDLILYGFGKKFLFDSKNRVKRFYQWVHIFYDNTTGSNRDLGFNLVTDDGLSQVAKYEYMVKQLKLTKGMKICDIGCGYGDWLRYCKEVVGCEVVGVNFTIEQARYAQEKYKIEMHITDWRNILSDKPLQDRLYDRFDAVTYMDTIEHYVSIENRRNIQNQIKIYSDVCILAKNLMNKKSSSQRVFISCLHQNRVQWSWKDYFQGYLVDKVYSGYYPFLELSPIMLSHHIGFKNIDLLDKTEDYRLTGVKDRKHFQAVSINWNVSKLMALLKLFFLDPFLFHRFLYYKMDSWMFFYGKNAYSEKYDLDYRKQVSFVSLYWATLELTK